MNTDDFLFKVKKLDLDVEDYGKKYFLNFKLLN